MTVCAYLVMRDLIVAAFLAHHCLTVLDMSAAGFMPLPFSACLYVAA